MTGPSLTRAVSDLWAAQLDLELAIWACLANARITAEQSDEDQHEHDLAA